MYSPKIKPELVPRIYEIAKARGTHMTTLVIEVLRKALDGMEVTETESNKQIQKGDIDEITNFN